MYVLENNVIICVLSLIKLSRKYSFYFRKITILEDKIEELKFPVHVVFIKDSAGRHLQRLRLRGNISSQSFVQLAARIPQSC